jgi:protein TonB
MVSNTTQNNSDDSTRFFNSFAFKSNLRGSGIGAGVNLDTALGMNTDTGGNNGSNSPRGSNESPADKVFRGSEVTQKAVFNSKPEPSYTEEAREHEVTGEVVLGAVLSSSGQVTIIKAVRRLPHGLTEKAIAAARKIKFQPAIKDNRPVSTYVTIIYTFLLY